MTFIDQSEIGDKDIDLYIYGQICRISIIFQSIGSCSSKR